MTASPALSGKPLFDQRQWLPWWQWLLPMFGALLLAAEVHLGHAGVRA